jgi:methylamine--corrinoid protein Co-methyltransferase
MPSLLDYLERSVTGPILTQKDFHMNVLIPNIRKIVKEFDIKYDPNDPVPSDDVLADRLYEASIEFLAMTGLYCADTNRIIQFDRKEIEKELEDYREAGTFGEGRDRY